MALKLRPRRARLGLAIDHDCLTAVWPGDANIRKWHISAIGSHGFWSDLSAALAELAKEFPRASVDIAVLPPLARARSIKVPPLHSDELVELLQREASRFFPSAVGTQAIALMARRGVSGRMVTSHTDEAFVTRLRAIVSESGLVLHGITSSFAPWLVAASRDGNTQQSATASGGESILAIAHSGILYQLRVRRNELVDVRHSVFRPAAEGTNHPDCAAMAARYTGTRRYRGFMTGQDIERRRRRRTIRRGVVATTSVLLVAAAAALDIVDTQREIRWVQHKRAAIAVQAEEARTELQEAQRIQNALLVLDSLERRALRAAEAVADLTMALPEQAYASLVFISADSSLLEGYADDATATFHGLGRASEWEPQGFSGAIQRQIDPTGASRDHFFIVLRPAKPGSPRS